MTSLAAIRLKFGLFSERSVLLSYDPMAELGAKLVEYWDATDEGTSRVDSTGGLIASWIGRKLGLNLVAAGAARPALSTSYCNGRKAFVFDGVGTFMRVASTTGLPVAATGGQIWVMYESIGAAATSFLAVYGGTAGGTLRRVGRSSSERWLVSDGTVTATATGTPGSTAGAHMSMGRWSGVAMDGRTHGAVNPVNDPIASLNTGTTRVTVGASNANTPASFARAAISAVFITDDTLTTDERQRLEAWGYREVGNLAALPSDHPFKEGPDRTSTFTLTETQTVNVARPAMQPFLIDFRTHPLDQIVTTCLGKRWVYANDGSHVLVPENTTAWLDHDPVSGDPLGIQNFSNAVIFNADRTLATPQVFDFSATGLVSAGFFDTNAILAVYALGSGEVRLQFSQPVEVLRADGTSETDWGEAAIMDDDVTIDCVDETADGWYTGVHYFKCPRAPVNTTQVTMTKVGMATIVHAEAARGVAGPPLLLGTQRRVAVMESPLGAVGLPRNLTSFTFAYLKKIAHCTQGGQFLTIDDDDLDNTIAPTNLQPVNRVAGNFLSNPRFDNTKDGYMGVSYCTTDDPGDPEGESGGIDPTDVVMEKMKWRCFFGTGDWTTGEVAVCCNGGAVRRAVFPTDRFPTNLQRIRWMGAYNAGNCPDGWLGAMYLEQASHYASSDAAIQAMCDPATSLFGAFDPD